MFSVKLVARPDTRMVEVPLEIEAELPREFEGAALLAASGLPRKVKIKAQKDALKLSTAYRTDQLVADIVKSALRGTALDAQRVQEAVTKFIRTVRERRQDGASLTVSSNGRGRIDVFEQLPQSGRAAAPAVTPSEGVPRLPAPPDRLTALEKRLAELEGAGPRGEVTERIAQLEQRIANLTTQLSRALAAVDLAGPGTEGRPGAQVIPRAAAGTRRTTAVEAYAEGLRHELLASTTAAFSRSRTDTERCDKAAALAAEAELLGAPVDGTAQRLRDASAQAAARQTALERLSQEIEFYALADLPVAAQLLARLEDGPLAPDPAPSLEPVAQAVVRAAKGGDCKPRTAWLKRGAALCGWTLVEPARGLPIDPEWHQAVDSGGDSVVRLACPGLKRVDGSGLVRARVQVDPAAAGLPEEPDEPAAIPEPLSPPPSEPPKVRADLSKAKKPGAPPGEPKASEPSAPPEAKVATAPELKAGDTETPPVSPAPPGSEPAPPGNALAAPFGDLAGAGEIRSDEAAAAAAAASRIPKIVSDDPTRTDEALAAEVALAVETETSAKVWAQFARGPEAFDAQPAGPDEIPGEPATVADDEVEEVHDLTDTLDEK